MSYLVFKLNSVPEDEANDVRQLLEDHKINFYETDSGRWGLGYAAIWMKDDALLEKAKSLIQEYQHQRYQRATSELDALKQSGQKISRLDFFMSSPIRFTMLIIFAGLLAYFTVMPFFK